MIKHTLCLSGIFLMLASSYTYAQTGTRLTLSQVWESTLSNYAGIRVQQSEVNEAQIVKKQVKNSFLPTVQFQIQNSFGSYLSSSGAFFPLPGVFNINGRSGSLEGQPGAAYNTFGSVVADWKFFEFGRKQLAIKAAAENVNRAERQFDAHLLQLKSESSRLYINILNSQINLLWAQRNAERTGNILELSASLANAGLKPGADTSLASSSHNLAMAQTDQWQAKVRADRINLSELAPLSLPESGMDFSRYLEPAPFFSQEDAENMEHPYLLVIGHELVYTRLQKQILDRKALPSFSLLGGVALRGSGIGADGSVRGRYSSGFHNRSDNYLVGAAVTWNLTGAYQSILERKRIQEQVTSTEARYEVEKRSLNTRLAAVKQRIDGQTKQIRNIQQAAENAGRAYDLYFSRYENGLISLSELLQIQMLLQQVEKSNIDAHQQLWDQILLESEVSGDFTYLLNHFN